MDLLLAHDDSLEHAIENNYLRTQFQKLQAAAYMLHAHEKESRNYLPDDIVYLIEVVELILKKSVNLAGNMVEKHSILADELLEILIATKVILEKILLKNEEVVLV